MTREEAIKHIITYAYYTDDIPVQVSTALDMAIAALRAQQEQESKPLNGWISVKDRLPEDQVEVLVLTRSKKGMRNVDKGYWSIDHFIHRGCAQVTHWMPLPELPEIKEMEEE